MNDERKVMELDLDDVLPNRFQPRIKFNEKAINELSESIKKHGVIQPIVVRAIGDKYEIIAGERRYKASVMAGKQTIPAIVANLNDHDSAEVALIENVQRQNLTPIEEAVSYKKILDMGYLTQSQLAEKLGKEQSTVANKLRLLNLNEDVQEALLEEQISERHARSLLRLNGDKQKEVLKKILDERLTVRKTDEIIDDIITNHKGVEIIDFSDSNEFEDKKPLEQLASTQFKEQPQQVETEEEQVSFNTGYIDIDRIEKEAQDIYVEKPNANIDNLLTPTPTDEDDEKPNVKQGRFFDYIEESVSAQEQTTNEVEINNNNYNNFISDELASNIVQPTPADEVKMIVPEFKEQPQQVETEEEQVSTTQGQTKYVTGSLKAVINTVRECAKTIEKYGFEIDTEEFDFEDVYQVIFKISK
jgi:ParB family chromosome partitioning protein